MNGPDLLLLALLAAAGLLTVARWVPRPVADVATRRVRFGPELAATDVIALLDVVAALPRSSVVHVTTLARRGRVEFWLSAPTASIEALDAAMSGIAPHVQLTPEELPELGQPTGRWHLGWRGQRGVLLRTDQNEASSAALLGALASTGSGEAVLLRHVLRPAGRRRTSFGKPADCPGLSTADATALTRKHGTPGLRVHGEVQVWTTTEPRARALLGRVLTVMRGRTGSVGQMRANRLDRPLDRSLGTLFGTTSATLSTSETVGLLAWPIGGPNVPGVAYDAAPRLTPPEQIPATTTAEAGRVFGVSNWPGREQRQLVQPTAGATCHSLIVGPSGSGKSWLLTNLLTSEIRVGHAAVLLDMKGDTAQDVLVRIPLSRQRDVVVLEPAKDGPLPGLRSFGGSPELAADLWLSVFRGLFPENFGVRSQRYLRMGLTTLARAERDSTIADLPRLFQDANYRRCLVARLDDPLLIGEWAAFEQLSIAQRSEHLLPALGKVSEVIARKQVRATLAQSRPRITITRAIASGKIVVVSLPPGVIGHPAAQLLGALVVFEVWQAVMARQSVAPGARRHVGFYIDEPAVLGTLPIPLDTLLETARGMNCGVTLAAQSLRQLPERVMRAALTNAATIATFRPSRADAKLLADELPGLTADQLQRLAPFTLALRLGLASGQVAPVTTARTLPLASVTSDADEVRRLSAEQFGVEPEDVDEALRARFGVAQHGEPVGNVPLGEAGGQP